MTLRVDEEIVGISAGIRTGQQCAVLHRECGELRRVAKNGEDLPGVSTERHREIFARDRDGPACRQYLGSTIHNGDHICLGEIEVHLTACGIELKAFRMDRQRDVGRPLESLGIDYRQTAAAISDQDLVGGVVHTDVVGILAKIDPPGRSIVCSREHAHRTVARVGDVKRVHRGHISEALRFPQSGNRLYDLTFLEVDDPDAVIAKFGNEESLPRQINRHVVDPTAHFAEWNLGFEQQRSFCLRDWPTNPNQQCCRCDRYRNRATSKLGHEVRLSLHAFNRRRLGRLRPSRNSLAQCAAVVTQPRARRSRGHRKWSWSYCPAQL